MRKCIRQRKRIGNKRKARIKSAPCLFFYAVGVCAAFTEMSFVTVYSLLFIITFKVTVYVPGVAPVVLTVAVPSVPLIVGSVPSLAAIVHV